MTENPIHPSDFERPRDCRIHWSCNGSIDLLSQLPASVFAVDDTASGTAPGDKGSIMLWRCQGEGDPTEWDAIGRWTRLLSARCIDEADTLVVVYAPDRMRVA